MAECVAWFEVEELVVVDIDSFGENENPPEGAEFFKILSPNKLQASLTALRAGCNVFESERCVSLQDLEMTRLNRMFNAQKLLSIPPIKLTLDPLPNPTLIAPKRFRTVDTEAGKKAKLAKAEKALQKKQEPEKAQISKVEENKYGYFLKLVGDFCPGYQFRGESDKEKADNLCKDVRKAGINPEYCHNNPEIRRFVTYLNLNFSEKGFSNFVALNSCISSVEPLDIESKIEDAKKLLERFDEICKACSYRFMNCLIRNNQITLSVHKKAVTLRDVQITVSGLPLLIQVLKKYEGFENEFDDKAEENKTIYIEFFEQELANFERVLNRY
jgi:uncharacterized protein (DUF924 family)